MRKYDWFGQFAFGVVLLLIGISIFLDPVLSSYGTGRINFGKYNEVWGFLIASVGVFLLNSAFRKRRSGNGDDG